MACKRTPFRWQKDSIWRAKGVLFYFDDIKHHVAINIEITMGYMITFNLLDNINTVFINFLKQIWIDMLVHSYDVDRALKQISKKAFQANN